MPKRERVVKSVLFSDGMGDGSDRFLLEPPAVEYAENLRIDKQGSLQKRPGFESLGAPPGATGTPFALTAFNDRLFSFTPTGAFAYDGTSWDTVTADTFVGGKEVVAKSPLERGLNHISCQPYVLNGQVTGYTIAYEVRASGTSDLQSTERKDKYVVIQWYGAAGKVQKTLRVDDAQNPKIFVSGLQHFVAYHRPESQDIRLRTVTPNVISATEITLNTPNVTQTNPLISHGSFDVIRSGRLGEVLEGNAHYHLAANDTDVFVLSTEHNTDANVSNVWLSRCDLITGAQVQLRRLHQRTGVTAGCIALDLQLAVSGLAFVHCLYAADEEVVAPTRIDATLYWETSGQLNINTPIVAETGWSIGDRTIVNAKIAQDPSNVELPTVVYQHGGSPTNYYERADTNYLFNFLGARPTDNAVQWHEFDLSTQSWGTAFNRLYHHRMTTNPIIDQQGNLIVGVQQYADYTPFARPESLDDWDEFVLLGPARKPVTTALARLDRTYTGLVNARATPIATLDAGRGAHTDPVDATLVTHVTQLVEIGNSYYAANRVITDAADVTMFFSNAQYDVGPNPATRTGAVEAGARAYINMHKVTPGGAVSTEPLGDGVVVASAMPLWFDGENFAELSPLETPEIIRIADTYHWNNNAEGELVYAPDPGHGGTSDYRGVRVIVGYADASGNIHRSAPSTTLYVNRITTGEAQSTNQKLTYLGKEVDITFTAPLTALSRERDYFVEVYVTDGEDDTPVLAHTQTIPANTTGDLANYTVTAQLIRMIPEDDDSGNPPTSWDNNRQAKLPARSTGPVYTEGGSLAADPWPAAQLVTSTSTRLWAVDAENKGRVVYSKLFEDYIGPEYNPTLAINLGDERNITAIGKLDDKVVIFEPDDIHVIYGDGPDNRGQGQEFAVHYIATDVGCTDQESVIETPVGLMFYSKPRGFYLLDRNMQVQFIGHGIEDTAAGIDIVSAQLVRDKAEVRIIYDGGPLVTDKFGPTRGTTAIDRPPIPLFTNTGPLVGPALSYNYERNTWLTYANYDGAAATIYQGKYTMLRNNWDVWQESSTRWDDPENLNLTTLATPWIKLSEQVQGFVALWKIRVLGRYLSSLQDMGGGAYEAGDVRVIVYFDYETTATQIKDFRVQDFGYNPFNNPPKRAERFQFEFEPKRGHCQAVKFVFSERVSESMGEPITYAQGRGFEITSVDLEMGVARQQALLPQAVRK